jgi:hypothetical protein
LDLAHRVIDVVKVQTSHGIEEHEWFGDAMHRELCISWTTKVFHIIKGMYIL